MRLNTNPEAMNIDLDDEDLTAIDTPDGSHVSPSDNALVAWLTGQGSAVLDAAASVTDHGRRHLPQRLR